MSPLRHLARLLLSTTFITGGADALLRPVPKGTAVIPGIREQDTETLVRASGAVQVAAGGLLALGRAPRLAALALAASLAPTTLAAHRFWEETDKAERQQQQAHFVKNVSMLGGLLLAAMDTEGRPGLAWRTRHAAEHAGAAVRRSRREARLVARAARAKLAA